MQRHAHPRAYFGVFTAITCGLLIGCGGITSVRLEEPTGTILQIGAATHVFPARVEFHQSGTSSIPIEMWIPLPDDTLRELEKPEFKDRMYKEGRLIEYRSRSGTQHPFIHGWGTIRVPIVPRSDVAALYQDKLSIPPDKISGMLHDGSVIKITVIDAEGRTILSLFVGPSRRTEVARPSAEQG